MGCWLLITSLARFLLSLRQRGRAGQRFPVWSCITCLCCYTCLPALDLSRAEAGLAACWWKTTFRAARTLARWQRGRSGGTNEHSGRGGACHCITLVALRPRRWRQRGQNIQVSRRGPRVTKPVVSCLFGSGRCLPAWLYTGRRDGWRGGRTVWLRFAGCPAASAYTCLLEPACFFPPFFYLPCLLPAFTILYSPRTFRLLPFFCGLRSAMVTTSFGGTRCR